MRSIKASLTTLHLVIALVITLALILACPVPGLGLIVGGSLLERNRLARYFVLRTAKGRKRFRGYKVRKQKLIILAILKTTQFGGTMMVFA